MLKSPVRFVSADRFRSRAETCLAEALEPRALLATFTVTNLLDQGAGSLRQAVVDAGNDGESSIILFQAGLSGTITLGGTELALGDGALDIRGPGSALLTIDANHQSRVFSGSSFKASGMTLRGGVADLGGGIKGGRDIELTDVKFVGNRATQSGGGFYGLAAATFTNCFFEDNEAVDGGGAWLASLDLINGPLTITSSIFRNNIASNDGGGLRTNLETTITSSTFEGNRAVVGGGIFSSAFHLRAWNTTISGNSASNRGGGYASNLNNYGAGYFTDSTISGNVATNGGGVSGWGAFLACTIAYNRALATDAATAGAGIQLIAGIDADLTLGSTILAHNTAGDALSTIVGGSVDAGSLYNLIDDTTYKGGLVNGTGFNLVGVDPKLAPLGFNGGPTKTHALLAGSPAIDSGAAGITSPARTTDQRGEGYARKIGAEADIGAFEYSGAELGSPNAGTGRGAAGASDASNREYAATVNSAGDVVVFEPGSPWNARNLRASIGLPAATGDVSLWFDPRDGLIHGAVVGADGLLLLERSESGVWSFQNLNAAIAGAAKITQSLTHFAGADQRDIIAGLAANNDVLVFVQTGVTSGSGFAFTNITAAGPGPGTQTAPTLDQITGYSTLWNTWQIAGIAANGEIWSIWTAPGTFEGWRSDNLTAITGAPGVKSDLTVLLTSWSGINIAALDADGNLVVTWWVPEFQGEWRSNNMTSETAGGVRLASLTGFTTSWGGMNLLGLDAAGALQVYWWVPSFGAGWRVDNLTALLNPADRAPTSALTAHTAPSGAFNILGADDQGVVVRTWWNPATDVWAADAVSENATRTGVWS